VSAQRRLASAAGRAVRRGGAPGLEAGAGPTRLDDERALRVHELALRLVQPLFGRRRGALGVLPGPRLCLRGAPRPLAATACGAVQPP